MNKRIKKKRGMQKRVLYLEAAVDFLIDQNHQLWQVHNKNVQAFNRESKRLREENKKIRMELLRVKEKKKGFMKGWR